MQADRRSRSCFDPAAVRRRLSYILLAVFVSTSAGCKAIPKIGEPAPPFAVSDLNGKTLSLSELKGKVVVLHFWATWCPPCLPELPLLFGLFKGLDPNRIVLLPVSTDRGSSKHVAEFLDSWGFDATVYRDPGGKVAGMYGTVKFPETYVLDADGILRRKVIGASNWKDPEWARYLRELSGDSGKEEIPQQR